MKNQWLKVPAIYAILTAIYYPVAYIIDNSGKSEGRNSGEEVFISLDSVFFWAHTNVLYLFTLIGSALIGLMWSYRKGYRHSTRGFGFVFIIGLAGFLVLLILGVIS